MTINFHILKLAFMGFNGIEHQLSYTVILEWNLMAYSAEYYELTLFQSGPWCNLFESSSCRRLYGKLIEVNEGCPMATFRRNDSNMENSILIIVGFVWKCWVNIPNEITIFHRDNDQQNHWVQWGTLFSDTPSWRTYDNPQFFANFGHHPVSVRMSRCIQLVVSVAPSVPVGSLVFLSFIVYQCVARSLVYLFCFFSVLHLCWLTAMFD